jgi:hypothetical protein
MINVSTPINSFPFGFVVAMLVYTSIGICICRTTGDSAVPIMGFVEPDVARKSRYATF